MHAGRVVLPNGQLSVAPVHVNWPRNAQAAHVGSRTGVASPLASDLTK